MFTKRRPENGGTPLYIAGPMESAGGNWNFPLFDYVAKKFSEKGFDVFNPAEHFRERYGLIENILAMDKDFRKMARRSALKDEINWIIDVAHKLVLLPGWQQSPGATAERAVALAVGVEVHELPNIILPLDGPDMFDVNVLDLRPTA